jgi:hypothetical protein
MNVSALGVTSADVAQLRGYLQAPTTEEAALPMVAITAAPLRMLCARIHKAEVLCGDLCFAVNIARAKEDAVQMQTLRFEFGEARLLRSRLSRFFLLGLMTLSQGNITIPRSEEIFLALRAWQKTWFTFPIEPAPHISVPRTIITGTIWIPALRLPGRAVPGIMGSRNHGRLDPTA